MPPAAPALQDCNCTVSSFHWRFRRFSQLDPVANQDTRVELRKSLRLEVSVHLPIRIVRLGPVLIPLMLAIGSTPFLYFSKFSLILGLVDSPSAFVNHHTLSTLLNNLFFSWGVTPIKPRTPKALDALRLPDASLHLLSCSLFFPFSSHSSL